MISYSGAILFFGIVGNAFVVKQFILPEQKSHPGSRLVIIQAVIDMISAATISVSFLPYYTKAAHFVQEWRYGEFLCIAKEYFVTAIPVSSWMMAFISMERYR